MSEGTACAMAYAERGVAGLQPPNPTKLKLKKKKTDFLHIMISKVLRHFPFSRNPPQKSADD
jgi:hypothetical protein